MDLKEIGVNMRNYIDSARDRECECGIETAGSIRQGLVMECNLW